MKKILFAIVFLFGCKRSFEPINYGQDACAHCKMTILDKRFAAELIDEKGKVFKFDDIVCMREFLDAGPPSPHTLYFVNDYHGEKAAVLDASKAVFLKHEMFKSPMNGNYAAFAVPEDAQHLKDSLQLSLITWKNLY
jgi:copper chaperone NosL